MELQTQLNPSSVSGNVLVTKILSIFETSLSILNQRKLENESTTPNSSMSHFGGSLFSNCGSDFFQGGSRKRCRKGIVTWTQQVRACEQGGFEGPVDDGYGWRKYGHKKIFGATYPRAYYKCSYQSTQNCLAMKQVQRSDLNSSMFHVTYIGKHSCSEPPELISGRYSPNKQEHIHGHSQIYQEQREDKSLEETYINFQASTIQIAKDKDIQLESYPSFSIYSTISLQPANTSNVLETRENHFTSTSTKMQVHSPAPAYINTPTTPGSNHFGGHCNREELLQTTVDSIEELDQTISSFLAPVATSSVNNDHLIHGSPWVWDFAEEYSHSY
ncbi:probable WRKY transcription factor 53 [Papaver somniferum]|uniref:probable WRKY transcription factor 53 n=1 Tax=Papaver somniferum TaxID=3469 RepID=UPI000E6FB211|nr:probable WRKY transcription factor 53 [Papaver somniferum]